MARISKALTLPQAPEGWQEKIEKIVARNPHHRSDTYFPRTIRRILRHEETETALRILMYEAKKRKVKFDLWILYTSIYKCAVLSFPFKSELEENTKRTKKLLDALRTVQKDVGLLGVFLGEDDDQFERILNKVLKMAEEHTRKKRGAPMEVTKYFCVVALQKYFIETFGTQVRPAIDALLTATFGPHDAISRIMSNARRMFPPAVFPDPAGRLSPPSPSAESINTLSRVSDP